jgi:hypothetical protein
MLAKEGEMYEMPNVIRYLVKEAMQSAKWYPEKAIRELFKELSDPAWEQIPELVRAIAEKSIDHKISGNQIKKVCLQFGLSKRVALLIAELKAGGSISTKLGSIPDVLGARSPIYELKLSIII